MTQAIRATRWFPFKATVDRIPSNYPNLGMALSGLLQSCSSARILPWGGKKNTQLTTGSTGQMIVLLISSSIDSVTELNDGHKMDGELFSELESTHCEMELSGVR
jgi:hypothetical protein